MRISDWNSDVCSSALWAGIERLLDELIAAYQHSHTDLSREHPRSLSNKLDYLKMMQHDERLPEKTREFLRCTRITAKRLGNNRHDIIHGLLHRVPGPHSITWRTQRIIYRSEEHTSELQSIMHNQYPVLCLKNKKTK